MHLKLEDVDVIVGVDQTGAVKPNGKAKTLPTAVLPRRADGSWTLKCTSNKKALGLESLQIDKLTELLARHGHDLHKSRTLVVVDSVIGLPGELQKSDDAEAELRSIMKRAAKKPKYGAKEAEVFFNQILQTHYNGSDEYPKRSVEQKLRANSVFRSRPYQKNIQTGTYRIWKDLTTPLVPTGSVCKTTLEQIELWPFTKARKPKVGRPVIIEGYPSLAWRLLNQTTRGKPLQLPKAVSAGVKNYKSLNQVSADHQDAAMLCLFAWSLLVEAKFSKPKQLSLEGDILGSHFVKAD